MIGRKLALLGLGFLLAALTTLATGVGSATAHTHIDLLTPVDGARLDSSPTRIVVRFGEPLSLNDTLVRVSQASGRTITTGPLTSVDPKPVHLEGTLDLPITLETGSYIITVTARGTDGHTVTDGYAFAVGGAPLIRSEGTTSVSDSWTARTVSFFSSLLTMMGMAAVGLAYVASWCWPKAARSSRGRSLVTGGLLASTLATFGEFLTLVLTQQQGAAAVLGSQAGRLLILRTLGLVAVAVALARWSHQADAAPPATGNAQNLMFGTAIPALLGVTGATHAAGDDWSLVTLLIGCVHFGGMALWVGGLLWLWIGVRSDAQRVTDAIRFSRTAMASAVVTIIAGVLLSYRLSWGKSSGVWGEPYGQVLMIKIALVAVLLMAANRTRLIVRKSTKISPPGGDPTAAHPSKPRFLSEVPGLAIALRVEAVCALAVVTIAGLLSLLPPEL